VQKIVYLHPPSLFLQIVIDSNVCLEVVECVYMYVLVRYLANSFCGVCQAVDTRKGF